MSAFMSHLPFLYSNGELDRSRAKWLLILIATLALGYWVYERSGHVYIDDARIASNVVIISANTSGWITDFPASSGAHVKAGQLLVQVDDRAAELELAEINQQIATQKAEIERTRRQRGMVFQEQSSELSTQQARLESVQAAASKASSELTLADSNFQRASTLRDKELISRKRWEEEELRLKQAQQSFKQAQSALAQGSAKLRKVEAQQISVDLLDQQVIIMQHQLKRLAIQRQQLALDVSDRQVRSPIDAVVDKTFSHSGEYVSPGRRVVMLHNPEDIWVNANIKETEMRHLRLGMKAKVSVDAYPDQLFDASVVSIANATSSEFALLPNPNPSGNFTKVTQRLRVKLALQQQQDLLKPGMMVEVTINTREI